MGFNLVFKGLNTNHGRLKIKVTFVSFLLLFVRILLFVNKVLHQMVLYCLMVGMKLQTLSVVVGRQVEFKSLPPSPPFLMHGKNWLRIEDN